MCKTLSIVIATSVLVCGDTSLAQFRVPLTDPMPLNTNAASDIGADTTPQIETDGTGTWIVVWRSTNDLGGTVGNDADIHIARSVDNGMTWSAPDGVLDTSDTSGPLYEGSPGIATDRNGNWVIVWRSCDSLGGTIEEDSDVLFSRSADNGETWTAPAPLNTNAATDGREDGLEGVVVATDGVGNWIAAWVSDDSLGGTIGDDTDILFARSMDAGARWTAPQPLNANAAVDTGDDHPGYLHLAADGSGNWVAVWASHDDLGGTIGTDRDILVAHSADDGATWSFPMPLNSNAYDDDAGDGLHVRDGLPHVATDRQGTWIVVWNSDDTSKGTVWADRDLMITRSTDNGGTWTPARALNTKAASDSGDDLWADLVTDRAGNWVVVWESVDDLEGTLGTDRDLLVAYSPDNGMTWTDPAPLNVNASSDSGDDYRYLGNFATDGLGTWMVPWYSTDALEDTIGTDFDILFARFSLGPPGQCPSNNDCCLAGIRDSCSDPDCCAAVCECDPSCCTDTWDQLCANQAAQLCPSLCPDEDPCGAGPCIWDISGFAAVSAGGSVDGPTGTIVNVGQAVMGSVLTSSYELDAGAVSIYAMLASARVPGDMDGDGDVDQSDISRFVSACFGGPEPCTPSGCEEADLSRNARVDLADFAKVQQAFGDGP